MLWPSKMMLSLAPTVLTYTTGTAPVTCRYVDISFSRVAGMCRVERRSGDGNDERGPRVQELGHGIHRVAKPGRGLRLPPDVLADGDSQPLTGEGDYAALHGRLEPAGLVEHVVRGQQGLGLGVQDGSVRNQRRDVEQSLAGAGAVPVHVPHDDPDAAWGAGLDGTKRLEVILHEPLVLQQVHRRVAAEAQLGEHRRARSRPPGPSRRTRSPCGSCPRNRRWWD